MTEGFPNEINLILYEYLDYDSISSLARTCKGNLSLAYMCIKKHMSQKTYENIYKTAFVLRNRWLMYQCSKVYLYMDPKFKGPRSKSIIEEIDLCMDGKSTRYRYDTSYPMTVSEYIENVCFKPYDQIPKPEMSVANQLLMVSAYLIFRCHDNAKCIYGIYNQKWDLYLKYRHPNGLLVDSLHHAMLAYWFSDRSNPCYILKEMELCSNDHIEYTLTNNICDLHDYCELSNPKIFNYCCQREMYEAVSSFLKEAIFNNTELTFEEKASRFENLTVDTTEEETCVILEKCIPIIDEISYRGFPISICKIALPYTRLWILLKDILEATVEMYADNDDVDINGYQEILDQMQ